MIRQAGGLNLSVPEVCRFCTVSVSYKARLFDFWRELPLAFAEIPIYCQLALQIFSLRPVFDVFSRTVTISTSSPTTIPAMEPKKQQDTGCLEHWSFTKNFQIVAKRVASRALMAKITWSAVYNLSQEKSRNAQTLRCRFHENGNPGNSVWIPTFVRMTH